MAKKKMKVEDLQINSVKTQTEIVDVKLNKKEMEEAQARLSEIMIQKELLAEEKAEVIAPIKEKEKENSQEYHVYVDMVRYGTKQVTRKIGFVPDFDKGKFDVYDLDTGEWIRQEDDPDQLPM